MNTRKPVIIFSVDRGNAAQNKRARDNAKAALEAHNIAYRVVTGSYKGQSEVAFVVLDDPDGNAWAVVRRLAIWNAQESVLLVDANGQARLESPKGDYIAMLGEFREVPESVAKTQAAYTLMDGRYFVAGYAPALPAA